MLRIFAVLVLVVFAGCATAPKAEAPKSEDAALAVRNQGYALLYKLLSDEKNLSKLLLIKKEQADLGELIKRISKVSGEVAEGMEKFSKADGHLHLEVDGLPAVEKEVRDSIGKTRAKELIAKGGQKFELRVLLTQSEALTYGAHLAAVLQRHESDEARRKFLAETSQRLQELHQGVIDLMHTRWDTPAR
ncbi:MAG TPA: hypothetical protein VM680_12875 [Verrucomicrobiae bacterium]|nr:hypothetical protein [Verrucomicrobiae bacterium]